MKKVLAAIVFMTLMGGFASAQSPLSFYAGGGIIMQDRPGTFDEYYDIGLHLTGGAGYQVFPLLEAVGKLEYHRYANAIDNVEDGAIKMLMYGVDLKLTPWVPVSKFKPYGLVGAGWASIKQDDFTGEGLSNPDVAAFVSALSLDDPTEFYYSFGGGVEWQLKPMLSAFLQAKYVTVTTSEETSVFINDIRLWTFTAGVKIF